jgi:hypothetical protein
MLSMIVKMLGNDVRSASDGREAIEMGSEFLPEVVLRNIRRPETEPRFNAKMHSEEG